MITPASTCLTLLLSSWVNEARKERKKERDWVKERRRKDGGKERKGTDWVKEGRRRKDGGREEGKGTGWVKEGRGRKDGGKERKKEMSSSCKKIKNK